MTVQTFIDDIQRTYPELTDAQVLDDLNVVNEELCKRFRINVGTETLSSFVSGTATYNMPANVAQVYSADYYQSSTSGFPLEPTTVQTLNNRTRGWRTLSNGTPVMFYVDGAVSGGTVPKVGFFPVPDTTTASSYPQCRMDVAYFVTLVTSSPSSGQSDVMPVAVYDHDAWKYGTYVRIAERVNDLARLTYWREQSKAAVAGLAGHLAVAEDVTPQGRFVNDSPGPRVI